MKRFVKSRKGYTLIELMTTMFIIAGLISLFIPNLRRAMLNARLAGCQTNLRNIHTSLKMYGTDNDELYPAKLEELEDKEYIKVVPSCPASNMDTYSLGYIRSDDMAAYTVHCRGKNHTGLGFGPNEPYYDLSTGLNPKK